MIPNFKEDTERWVLVNGVNSINVDIAPHVINELGSNGEEVELLFISCAQAMEYKEANMLDDYMPTMVTLTYYKGDE